MKLEMYRKALQEVYNVLGPYGRACSDNKCLGCAYEMGEAFEAARKALGIPKKRRKSGLHPARKV
jgi:hypothetical protein